MKNKIILKNKNGDKSYSCNEYLIMSKTGTKIDIVSSASGHEELLILLIPLFEILNHELDLEEEDFINIVDKSRYNN